MAKLTIDGKEIEVEDGSLVIQAAEQAGIEIPRFCYHERLSVAGNCRMCLVEVEGGPPKPAASCALPVNDGMVVKTNSPMVKKAREGVMEFLLVNHPLDCPICDQGGECDLQDQSMYFGAGESRYEENKRAVPEKHMGPLIKTHMTRCIHCTRCIRFCDDVAGTEEMGAVNRGEHMEITTYLEKSLSSELSANVIDLCPVGALTSRPYAFHARPWELKKTESIDVLDAVGSNIRIDTKGREVMRILPRNHDDVNEEWISDKTRYACDGLKTQRLDKPYMRVGKKLQPCTWDEALNAVAEKLTTVNPSQIGTLVGAQVEAESIFAFKQILDGLKIKNQDCRNGAKLDPKNRASYLFNTTISGLEEADAILLIGTNPRIEAPIINARIRKTWLNNNIKIANIGQEFDLTYPAQQLKSLADATKFFKGAKNPVIILGQAGLTLQDAAQALAIKIGGTYNYLHTRASTVAALDLGFASDFDIKKTSLVYLLGEDEIDPTQLKDKFVIYQGHHGDAGAHCADIILPGAAYTEKDGTYLNTEGRVQQTLKAVLAPGEAKEDWKILRALSDKIGNPLSYNNLDELRESLYKTAPHFANLDQIKPEKLKKPKTENRKPKTENFDYPIKNFYQTCPISRNSKTMAECSSLKTEIKKAAA